MAVSAARTPPNDIRANAAAPALSPVHFAAADRRHGRDIHDRNQRDRPVPGQRRGNRCDAEQQIQPAAEPHVHRPGERMPLRAGRRTERRAPQWRPPRPPLPRSPGPLPRPRRQEAPPRAPPPAGRHPAARYRPLRPFDRVELRDRRNRSGRPRPRTGRRWRRAATASAGLFARPATAYPARTSATAVTTFAGRSSSRYPRNTPFSSTAPQPFVASASRRKDKRAYLCRSVDCTTALASGVRPIRQWLRC